jgi:hypothetical protein
MKQSFSAAGVKCRVYRLHADNTGLQVIARRR